MSQTPRPRRRPARPRCAALALVPVIGAGALTGCAGTAEPAAEGDAVKVMLGAASGARSVQAGDLLKLTARGGVLTEVRVTDPRGRGLPGRLGSGGRVWTSGTRAAPATKYSIVVRTRSAQGDPGATKESLTTASAEKLNTLAIGPGRPGAGRGADRPVAVTFDFPVTDREAVERRLSVTGDVPAAGSWRWSKDASGRDRADWQPASPPEPGTMITLRAELNGVDSGGGRYFAKDYDLNFTIGRTCTDSDATRVCGKVHVGDPVEIAASPVRGKDDTTIGVGDGNVVRSPQQQNSAPAPSS
ncbi:Ig-like domain-containing protein [Streptomyces sp. NPDC020742]|uniref:Ig-like domain-containing protein n=1 Tax=unclassified Streptomyces TaxID=2593676 RepID=UPI0033CFD082